jgi:hypothetical protein
VIRAASAPYPRNTVERAPSPPFSSPTGRRHRHVAAQGDAEVGERVEGDEVGYEASLHVAGAAAVEQVSLHDPRERVVLPGVRVPSGHGVGVGVEQDGASASLPPPYPGDVRAVLVGVLLAYVVEVGLHLRGRSLPHVYLQAALSEGALDGLPHRALPTRYRGDADELLQQPHRIFAPGINGGAYGSCEFGAWLRHPSRPPSTTRKAAP